MSFKIGYKMFNIKNKQLVSIIDDKFQFKEEMTHPDERPLSFLFPTGFYSCDSLKDLFINQCVPSEDSTFYIIEITGDFLNGHNKNLTKSFRLLMQLEDEFVQEEYNKYQNEQNIR